MNLNILGCLQISLIIVRGGEVVSVKLPKLDLKKTKQNKTFVLAIRNSCTLLHLTFINLLRLVIANFLA